MAHIYEILWQSKKVDSWSDLPQNYKKKKKSQNRKSILHFKNFHLVNLPHSFSQIY